MTNLVQPLQKVRQQLPAQIQAVLSEGVSQPVQNLLLIVC